jgi:hypothetical protein
MQVVKGHDDNACFFDGGSSLGSFFTVTSAGSSDDFRFVPTNDAAGFESSGARLKESGVPERLPVMLPRALAAMVVANASA